MQARSIPSPNSIGFERLFARSPGLIGTKLLNDIQGGRVEIVDSGNMTWMATPTSHELVDQMTLDEKLGCLEGDIDAWPGLMDMVSGGYHRRTFPAGKVERLGLPGIEFSDGPRGCVVGEKTAFPVSMARGASWDTELEERIGEAIGAELRTVGANFYGGVCVNLLRHPGWGRAQETYGEDPHHVGRMGAALMRGAQTHVMACVKHFAVNSMENARFKVDVQADERALHEVYLPHFRHIVEQGVASVMSAYNSLNGTFCGDNTELLTTILRDEWGFDGFVISDFIFGLRDAALSVKAGLDIEMPFRQQRTMHLRTDLANGTLTEADIDVAVERIVRGQLTYLAIDRPAVHVSRVCSPAHLALAREAATKSIVLLRNEGSLMPLDAASLKRVAVVGRLAAVPNLGDGGSSDVIVPSCVTPLDGLRAALPNAVVVHHDHDADVVAGADVAIVVVGYTSRDEGEYIDSAGTVDLMASHFPKMTNADRQAIADAPKLPSTTRSRDFAPGGDRRSIALSADDEALIRAVVEVNPRTVVAVMGGSAVVMESWRHSVPAIVLLWYPGMEGGHAFADILLGNANPSGRLPFSIPTDELHLPHWNPDAETETYDLWHGHWKLARDRNDAAYPFGFGLSYTSFKLADARLDASGDTVLVGVSNTGGRDGTDVVQIYAGLPGSRYERPAKRLVGFARVDVPAGETVDVVVPIDMTDLRVRENGRWVTEAGAYLLTVARSAADPLALTIWHQHGSP
jgi:beta-glucosidase